MLGSPLRGSPNAAELRHIFTSFTLTVYDCETRAEGVLAEAVLRDGWQYVAFQNLPQASTQGPFHGTLNPAKLSPRQGHVDMLLVGAFELYRPSTAGPTIGRFHPHGLTNNRARAGNLLDSCQMMSNVLLPVIPDVRTSAQARTSLGMVETLTLGLEHGLLDKRIEILHQFIRFYIDSR